MKGFWKRRQGRILWERGVVGEKKEKQKRGFMKCGVYFYLLGEKEKITKNEGEKRRS